MIWHRFFGLQFRPDACAAESNFALESPPGGGFRFGSMNNSILLRVPLTGLIVWLVPFLVAIPFYTPAGELRTDIFLFKTVMRLVSAPLGLGLLSYHLRRLPGNYLRGGLVAGLVWLVINWALDFAVLLPLSGMSLSDYFVQIGLGYLVMPITGYFMGQVLELFAFSGQQSVESH